MRRRFSLCFFLLLAPCIVYAQEQSSSKPPSKLDQVYIDYGIGPILSNSGGFTFSTAVVASWPSGWGGVLRLRVSDIPSLNESPDYSSGLCIFGCEPRDNIVALIPAARRLFKTGNPQLAFAVEAGPALVFSKQNIFTRNSNTGLFGPSHLLSKEKESGIGVAGRVSTQLRFHPAIGLEVGISGLVNAYHNTISVDLAFLAGRLRQKLKT